MSEYMSDRMPNRMSEEICQIEFQLVWITRRFFFYKWGWFKTLYCCSHENNWDLWMSIPLKMVCKKLLIHGQMENKKITSNIWMFSKMG